LNLFIFSLFTYLSCCAPANYNPKSSKSISKEPAPVLTEKKTKNEDFFKKPSDTNNEKIIPYADHLLSNNVVVLVSIKDDVKVVNQFINIIEFAIYKKKLNNISFQIYKYNNQKELLTFLNNNNKPGQIYFGPISTQDTKQIKNYCDSGAIFFSFASEKELAGKCIYLLNFFPENEIKTLFNYFPPNSKIALIYPQNSYGYRISNLADSISESSKSIIVNRASYKEDLTDIRVSIKELGKYELRKYELNRQKKILALKKDQDSKNRLKRLEKFVTTNDYDFTHIIIADYGLRLLQVAPLLAYYDIDPNVVKFVGTGAWDDFIFFNEPSLQGSIFPGIEYYKRKSLIDEYEEVYEDKLLRISTLPFDLVGLTAYLINNKYNLEKSYNLLNNSKSKFDGVDGNFYFISNLIERDLEILMIKNGEALKLTN
tara:strand:+ start:233 stop:1516 length:1284 start_codon:yes stop_codon:yes gene_type:complete